MSFFMDQFKKGGNSSSHQQGANQSSVGKDCLIVYSLPEFRKYIIDRRHRKG